MPSGVYKRKPFTEEHKRNISIVNIGRKHTEETKRKMSIAKKGKVPWCKGKKLSKEHRENIGKSRIYPKGEKHPNWKGGVQKHSQGYVLIHKLKHPFAHNGYVYEHRLVVEKQIGRYLTPKEKTHHLGKKDDNRPHMLMAFISHSAHMRFERNGIVKQSEIIFDGRNRKKCRLKGEVAR